MPQPHILSILLAPKIKADQEKMDIALSKLAQEDPTLEVRTDEESGQTIISGMSELHLEILVDRMKREHKVEANAGKPRVAFRETIRKQAEGEGRYVRQTDGLDDYGHVKLRIEPNETGNGYEFINNSKGGVVPGKYIEPIELGIQEAMQSGVLAGCQMVDIKVVLCDGSFHDLYSNEMAFKIAGSMAFKEAARKAKPVLQEPIMSVEVTTPEEYAETIIGDLNSRRGRIQSVEMGGGASAIKAMVPLSKILGYAIALRGLSQGRANFMMEFKQYEASPDEGDFNGEEPSAIPAGPKRPRPGSSSLQAMREEWDVDS